MHPKAPPRRFDIRIDRELTHPQVLSLLDEHLAGMRAASPPECVFALDLNGLRRPEITFLTAWRLPPDAAPGAEPEAEGELVAMGALKELTPTTATAGGHGELKSMRTSARHLRQGAAQAILTELLTLARVSKGSLQRGPAALGDAEATAHALLGMLERARNEHEAQTLDASAQTSAVALFGQGGADRRQVVRPAGDDADIAVIALVARTRPGQPVRVVGQRRREVRRGSAGEGGLTAHATPACRGGATASRPAWLPARTAWTPTAPAGCAR